MGWSVKTAAAVVLVAAQVGCFQKSIDPPPPPASQCTDVSDPLGEHVVGAELVKGDGGSANVQVMILSYVEQGIGIAAVRVTGGTLVGIENMSYEGTNGDVDFYVTLSPDPGVLPDAGVVPGAGFGTITVEIDFVCGTVTTTKQFRVMGPISPSGGLSIVGV